MPGRTISHYEILEKLGEGGMGVVYRAQDTILSRTVALKVLSERMSADDTARARLLREARTASALNHPNVCTVYEIGESGGQTYIAMEHVEGRTLDRVIPPEGMAQHEVLDRGTQIAEALAHSHDRGVVHRDLKSTNVMVTPEGRVKVLDFGLAKQLAPGEDEATRTHTERLTQKGMIVGTLAYMSPEMLLGEPADTRSDIWSFGVLLYEMASGRLPFRGRSTFDLTAAVLKEPVPELPATVGTGLRAIIQRCLAREPGKRYQRGSEVQAALEAIQSASMPLPAAGAALSRRRWLWTAGAAAAMVGVAGGIFWRVQHRTYTPPISKVPEADEYFRRAMLVITTQQDLPRARQFLEKALELDPKFALARAWYGFSHLLLLDQGRSNDTGWLYKAEEELRRALQDDPNSARAHASLSAVYSYQGRKELALEEARKAIKMDPNEREGYSVLGILLMLNGEYEQSRAIFKKLLDADPLFFPARMNIGMLQLLTGDAQSGIRELEKVLEQDPKNFYARTMLAWAHMTIGALPKARQILEGARSLEPENYALRLLWVLQLALEGSQDQARRELDPEVLKFGELPVAALAVAEIYAVLGDKAKSLEWLDRTVRAGDERAEWFQRDALLANIRAEPRFRQILDAIRFRRGQRASANR